MKNSMKTMGQLSVVLLICVLLGQGMWLNPCSIILSAVMMLEYLGWKEAATLIEKALEQSFLDARATHDLARFMPNGTSLSTSAFTREIVERIEK